MKKEFVNLKDIVNKINEKNGFEVLKENKASEYFSELKKMIGIDENLYLIDPKKKNLGYKIPIELEGLLIFFLKNWTSNQVIKSLRKEFKKVIKYREEDSINVYGKDKYYNEAYNIKKEFIKFILESKEIEQDHKMEYISKLSQSNMEIYEVSKDVILNKIEDKMVKMSKELSYKNKEIDMIDLDERIYLLYAYNEKFNDMLEELKIAKSKLDSQNIDILKETSMFDYIESINDAKYREKLRYDNEILKISKIDKKKRIDDIIKLSEIEFKAEKANNIKKKISKEEINRSRREIEKLKHELEEKGLRL